MCPEAQRTRVRIRSLLCWLACLLLGSLGAGLPSGHADEVGSAVYVRTDSDHTTVISPRARAKGEVAPGTSVDVSYGADVWTSASIDIRTAASKVVMEQRDEIDLGVSHELESVTLGGGYRFSKENDYESHSGSASFSYNFADNAATLAVSAFVSGDTVGRSGDPMFKRPLTSFGTRLGFTQVLDPKTVLQASYDLAHFSGYQSSPYRYVGIGGDGRCHGSAPMCVPEREPDQRLRHAVVGRVRRAFTDELSAGVSYRFYFDDWKLSSHTIEAQLAWLPDPTSQIVLRYRFYTQGDAKFYKPLYLATDNLRYVTIDRELSAMGIQRVGLDFEHGFDLGDETRLKGVLSPGVDFYKYDHFPGLKSVTALELSLAAVLQL
jgi:hypothetical protein